MLISDEYVRSAIRYLDPDEEGENGWSLLCATVVVGLLLGILFVILLRGT